MHLVWRYVITSCLILISFYSNSQDVKPFNSSEILEKASDLYKNEKYREAINLYKVIPRSDTNYRFALYNISLSSYNDSNYTEGKKYAEEGLKIFPEKDDDWKNLIASNLEKLGKVPEALGYYDELIKKSNGNNYIALFNKGITYYNLKNNEEAKKCFQKVILINPYYASAHYYLGNIAYQEGSLVPAMLSYATTLMINPEHTYSAGSIRTMSMIAQVNDEVSAQAEKKKDWKSDNFEEIQDILISKIALDKQYKIKAQLEDAIVRQIQVALEKLSYNKADKGFWMQYYVPVFEKLFKEGQFEPFIFHIFSSVDVKEVKGYMKNNKKRVDNFIPLVTNYLNEIRETQILEPVARTGVSERFFFADNKVAGKGKIEGEGKNAVPVGLWEFYHDNGKLKSKGVLAAKQVKTGEWVFYHPNGQLMEKTTFINDKAEGKSYVYFDNGVVSAVSNYVNGELSGESRENFYNGLPMKVQTFVNGKKEGTSKTYTAKGVLLSVASYREDKLEGAETFYYKNGKVSTVSQYKNGELNGDYKSYYLDGTLNAEGSFADGKKSGSWKIYHNNGKLKTAVSYVAGEATGDFREHHYNGAIMVKGTYDKGKWEGKYEDFESDGKLFSESVFEKGRLKDLKFFNKEGKMISNISTRTGAANLVYYDGYGNKTSEGYFTKDGERDGKTTYYYRNGKVSGVSNFKKGLLDGEKISYYANGAIAEKTFFKNDEENGYRIGYFSNGKIKNEGRLVNGSYDGLQVHYNEFGNIISKTNYAMGELEGYTEYYHPNGKIDSEHFYTSGWLYGFKDFDTTGSVMDDVNIEKGNAEYVINNYAGHKYVNGSYKNHYLHGEHKSFYPDGSTSVIQYHKHGHRDSIFRKYYYGGQLEYEGKYKMDEKDGKWDYFHDNGKPYYSEVYNNGRLNGVTKIYNDDGTIDKESSYTENQLDGPYKIYGEDGQLAVVLNYDMGKLINYTYENKDGKLLPEIAIKNGAGNIISYYKNGNKSTELSFEEDDVNGIRKIYFSNGNIYIDGARSYGLENGPKKVYFVNGKVSKEENYINGNMHGHVKEYFNNGKIKSEENWHNGDLHGVSRYYDIAGKPTQTRTYYYGVLQSVK